MLDIALLRTTHMAIGAHPDDLEIMALHGILECFGESDKYFTGVRVTNGAGSARDGAYAAYTDEQMQAVRRSEQKKAALVGDYSAVHAPVERREVADLARGAAQNLDRRCARGAPERSEQTSRRAASPRRAGCSSEKT